MDDLLLAVLFWLTFEAVSLPLRWLFLTTRMSGDVRRLLSRVMGPAFLALLVWTGAHGLIPIGPRSGWILVFVAGAFAIVAVRIVRPEVGWRRIAGEIFPVHRRTWRRDLITESVFLGVFLLFVAFRRWVPEMTHEIQNSGAEKFANAMHFWSCWHTEFMPPQDYWFAGQTQPYYVWGHFFWSWVGRLGGFPGETVISLGLSRLVLLVTEAGVLLLRSFGLKWGASLGGGMVLAWGGNPHVWFTAWSHFGGSARFGGQGSREMAGGTWGGYPFWEPSRVIEHTVNEFPAWSAILGDFHAHHLGLPWLIGWFAVLMRGDRWMRPAMADQRIAARRVCAGLLWISAGTLGIVAALTNLWITPVVLATTGFAAFWQKRGFRIGGGVGMLAFILTGLLAAFYLDGQRPLAALGPAPTTGQGLDALLQRFPLRLLPASIRSSPGELLALWGFQMVVPVVAILVNVREGIRTPLSRAAYLAGGFFLSAWVFFLGGWTVGREEPALIWLALGSGLVAISTMKRPWLPFRVGLAGLGACVLLAGLEFFYIPDRMVAELVRYNSYFKLSYPVWPVLSGVAWVVAVRAWRRGGRSRAGGLVRLGLAGLVPFLFGMILFGVPARVHQARMGDDSERAPTLDAFRWLEWREPYVAEAEMLAWIRQNVPPGDLVIEAVDLRTSAYDYWGRVASLGGRPVPLGWAHHEMQWRGGQVYEELEERERLVRTVYEAPDVNALREGVRSLNAHWIVVGRNERRVFGAAGIKSVLAILQEGAELRASFGSGEEAVHLFHLE